MIINFKLKDVTAPLFKPKDLIKITNGLYKNKIYIIGSYYWITKNSSSYPNNCYWYWIQPTDLISDWRNEPEINIIKLDNKLKNFL